MTASKIWALVVGLIVIGGGLAGTAAWRQSRAPAPPRRVTVYPTERQPQSSTLPATRPALPASPAANKEQQARAAETAQGATPEAATPDPGTKRDPASRAEAPIGKNEPPHFDIVRIEPTGDAVLAGKGAPNAKVALLQSGKQVAETKADPSGNFVMLPPPLAPGDYDLTLRQEPKGETAKNSAQSIAVSVPRTKQGPVIVALAEPGKPTRVLSGSSAAGRPAKPTGPLAKADAAKRAAPADRATAPTPENLPAAGTGSPNALQVKPLNQAAAGPAAPQPGGGPTGAALRAETASVPNPENRLPAAVTKVPSGPERNAPNRIATAKPTGPTADGAPANRVVRAESKAARDTPPAAVASGPSGTGTKSPSRVALAKPQTELALPSAIAPSGPSLTLGSVELENGNGFFASGTAPPGTPLHLYLNNSHIADVIAAKDGRWTLTIKRGLTGGHYIVRADASPDGRTVTSRVEVPFDVPVAIAEAAKPKPQPTMAPRTFVASSSEAPAPPSAPNPSEVPGVPRAPVVGRGTAEAASAGGSDARFSSSANAPPPPSAPAPSEVAGLGPAEPEAMEPAVRPRASVAPSGVARGVSSANAPPPPSAPAPSEVAGLGPAEPEAVKPAAVRPRASVAASATARGVSSANAPPPASAPAPSEVAGLGPAEPEAGKPSAVGPRASVAASGTARGASSANAPPPPSAPAPSEVAGIGPAEPARSPVEPKEAQAADTVALPAALPTPTANAVIEDIETALVARGDNLWNISRTRLGQGHRYTQIFTANEDQIRDPDLIYPGQVFVMPRH